MKLLQRFLLTQFLPAKDASEYQPYQQPRREMKTTAG
jgi:hypothetical protein